MAVTEGSVELRGVSASAAPAVTLAAGDRGELSATQVTVRRGVSSEADAAWTRGRLVFRDTPLEVVRFGKHAAASPAVLQQARALLEGLAPEAMTRAAREMAARWVASLEPLEPVLVRRERSPRKAPSRPRTRS